MNSFDEENNSMRKIESLIANKFLRKEEKNLVLLLLLTRTNSQCINSVFNRELFIYSSALVKTNRKILIRLVSKLVIELENKNDLDWTLMAKAFLGTMKHHQSVDKCVFEAVTHCFIVDESCNIDNDDLNIVWERFQRRKCASSSTSESEGISDHHWIFVEEIINQLICDGVDEDGDKFDCSELVLCLLQGSGPALCAKSMVTPLWYEEVIKFVVSRDLDSPECSKTSWQELVFACAKSLCNRSESRNLMNTSSSKGLCDLVTLHLGSPTSNLRLQAWQACSVLVTSFGWSWTEFDFQPKVSSHFCVWTRLAVGEYNLQLEHAAAAEPQLCDEVILEACGNVITASMRELVQEADACEKGMKSLTPEILLHLRQSFFECLKLTIAFFCLETAPPFNTTATKVLGSLLSEFSIWDDLGDCVKCEDVLFSVRKATNNKGIEMMPALATIFVAAEESPKRIEDMRAAGLFREELFVYFEWFFRHAAYSNPGFIQWACLATTSYCAMAEQPEEHISTLRKLILLWIETILQNNIQKCQGIYLRSAVDCYMLLTGDKVLHQPVRSTINTAMQRVLFCQVE
mmetsp:Transcript_25131/g.37141  ORF Transcript_25131/g.37141 Transcript_25131/m.37141 type:complete len:575 (+) Transcript_25131:59-1783(+)